MKSSSFFVSPALIVLFFSVVGLSSNLYFYSDWGAAHFYYVSGVFWFILSYFLLTVLLHAFFWKGRVKVALSFRRKERSNKCLIHFYWTLAAIGAALSVYQMVNYGFSGGNFFYNLRYAHSIEKQGVPLVGHLSLFSLVLAMYYVYCGKFRLASFAVFLTLLASLAVAARADILMKLAAVSYVYFFVYGFRVKNLLVLSAFFFGLIFLVAYGTGKVGGEGGEYFIFKYLGYGITTFQDVVVGSYGFPCYSLVFGNVIGGSLDYFLGTSASCNLVPSVEAGLFNVFTYAYAPYIVFGPSGLYILMWILGIFYAAVNFISLVKGGPFLFLSSALTYPLIMIFFDWQFDLSTFVYVFLISLPLFLRLKPMGAKLVNA